MKNPMKRTDIVYSTESNISGMPCENRCTVVTDPNDWEHITWNSLDKESQLWWINNIDDLHEAEVALAKYKGCDFYQDLIEEIADLELTDRSAGIRKALTKFTKKSGSPN